MLLTQTKYIQDLLSKVNMVDANGVNTLIFGHCKLSKHGTNTMLDLSLYRLTIRTWQYVTLTWFSIAYYVNKAFHFMANAFKTHLSVVKRILIYLSGPITHVIMISLANSLHKFSLKTYIDSYWPSDSYDWRSTSSSYVYFILNIVS